MAEKASNAALAAFALEPICRAHEGRSDWRHGRLCARSLNAIPDGYTMRSSVRT